VTIEDGEGELRLDRLTNIALTKEEILSRGLWQSSTMYELPSLACPHFFSFRCPLIAHNLCAVRRFEIDVQCYIHSETMTQVR
jgi:hypothetical protein